MSSKINQNDCYTSYFLKNTKFSGKIYTKKSIIIETQIDADITALNSVIVQKDGLVNGNIIASSLICSGEVNGNIQTSDFTEINSTGKVVGNIRSTNLVIQKGGSIMGKCKVTKVKI